MRDARGTPAVRRAATRCWWRFSGSSPSRVPGSFASSARRCLSTARPEPDDPVVRVERAASGRALDPARTPSISAAISPGGTRPVVARLPALRSPQPRGSRSRQHHSRLDGKSRDDHAETLEVELEGVVVVGDGQLALGAQPVCPPRCRRSGPSEICVGARRRITVRQSLTARDEFDVRRCAFPLRQPRPGVRELHVRDQLVEVARDARPGTAPFSTGTSARSASIASLRLVEVAVLLAEAAVAERRDGEDGLDEDVRRPSASRARPRAARAAPPATARLLSALQPRTTSPARTCSA